MEPQNVLPMCTCPKPTPFVLRPYDEPDGYKWRCKNNIHSRTTRKNSFFERSHYHIQVRTLFALVLIASSRLIIDTATQFLLNLYSCFCIQDLMTFIYSYLEHKKLTICTRYSGISYDNRAIDWGKKIRKVMVKRVQKLLVEYKLGGEGFTVEVSCVLTKFLHNIESEDGGTKHHLYCTIIRICY